MEQTGGIPKKKMSLITYIAYACGDLASNLCWTFIGSYLSIFYTDVVGMTPAVASALMLAAKIWDGVNDPMFGAIAERTKTRFGRFRPYILFGSPFLAVFAVLTFTTFGTGSAAVAWAAFTYIGCGMLYTVVNLSYGSLSTVMTGDPKEIVNLNSWRMIGTNVGSVMLNAISAPLLMYFSGGAERYTAGGYTKLAILYAICAFPLFMFVVAKCREVITPVGDNRNVSLRNSFKSVVSNKPLMLIFFMQLFGLGAFFGRMGVAVYYFIYGLHRMDLISLLMALPSVTAIIGIVATRPLWMKVGRTKSTAIGYAGQGCCLFAIWLTGNTLGYESIPLIIGLHAVYGFFLFTVVIPMSMVPDAINYAEDKSGIRSDGISYAAISLSTKFASAFGVSGALLILGATGYVANAEQTAEAIGGINFTVNLLFAIVSFIAVIPALMYPLTEQNNAEIRARLDQKKL